jgi:hypothetical protein
MCVFCVSVRRGARLTVRYVGRNVTQATGARVTLKAQMKNPWIKKKSLAKIHYRPKRGS